MTGRQSIDAQARAIIDANRYVTLATADEDGRPWASPVFFAAAGYAAFYWMSVPEARHSRNLAVRPGLSIVILDSTVCPGHGKAVYMSATAEQAPAADRDAALVIYPGPPERGAGPVSPDRVRPPGPYRLYRATVTEHPILCPREPWQPCALHGMAVDHRAAAAS